MKHPSPEALYAARRWVLWRQAEEDDRMRRAVALSDRFAFVTPKTDIPTPEQYFGLPPCREGYGG